MRHVQVLAAGALALIAAPVGAVEILKREPPAGALRPGEPPIFVESGKCSKGQVMKVMAGTMGNRNGRATSRIRECVARPS